MTEPSCVPEVVSDTETEGEDGGPFTDGQPPEDIEPQDPIEDFSSDDDEDGTQSLADGPEDPAVPETPPAAAASDTASDTASDGDENTPQWIHRATSRSRGASDDDDDGDDDRPDAGPTPGLDATPRHMGSESDRAGWYGPDQDLQAPCRDEPMDLPRAQSPSPIPPEHQDLSLRPGVHVRLGTTGNRLYVYNDTNKYMF